MTTQMTVTEQIACQLLKNHQVGYNPAFSEWVEQVINDPDFSDLGPIIDRHALSTKTAPDFQMYGPESVPSKAARARQRGINAAIFHLAAGICTYRNEGRDDHATTREFGRMTDIYVTTSLAAKIVEFHQLICDAYARENREMEFEA